LRHNQLKTDKPIKIRNNLMTKQNLKEPNMKTYQCIVCGFIYDEAQGLPADGIAAGTRWDDIPADWACPDCGVAKADFEMMEI
jgi:rubredoxin